MSSGPRVVTRRAHAKINVFLRVLDRRVDGFHDIESVVVPISLHDVVTVATGGGRPSTVDMDVHGVWVSEPVGERENIVSAATERFLSAAFPDPDGRPAPRITVGKWIPVAAGLGGGSADAAATLHALNELFGCGWPADALAELGAEIGSDVPGMLAGDPVLITGRGERLVPVHAATTWWVVKPFRFPVAAADAYGWWDDAPATGPDPGVLIAALETGDVGLLGDALFNDLQPAVVTRHPEVGETIAAFMEAGALGAAMSGSGPTVAALARHLGHADSVAAAVPGSMVVSGPPVGFGTGGAEPDEG
ncbi:MAG: 4-(cytidine 5'-diphospho)-2-C-methyl-D-erythritol kinase [Actinomycetota bacterium]